MEIKCICPACNNEFIWQGSGISHFNRAKKHYCSRNCQNVKHSLSRRSGKKDKTEEYNRYQMWLGASKRCKKSGLEFNIEPQDIPNIPDICPILNIKIEKNKNAGPLDSSPSLDRIDSTKGYIKGNIRVISNRANRIKSDSTFEEIKLIYEDYIKNINKNDI